MTDTPTASLLHLRSFNEKGIERAFVLLEDMSAGLEVDLNNFVVDDELTIVLSAEPILLPQAFSTRYECAKYFNNLLAPFEGTIPDIERDKGLWTWLAFCWLDLLAPKQSDGSRKIGEWRRWILSNDRKRHRHLLATPYRIYRTHRDDPACVLVVLCGPVDIPGNITEQIASRQDIVKSKTIMKALTDMYYLPALGSAAEDARLSRVGQLRDGASTSAVRMGKVLGQFYLTWDMFAMEAKEIIHMLPSEFDKFKATN